MNFVEYEVHQKCTTGGRDGGGRRHGGDRVSWHLFHDFHSSYIVAAAIGAGAGGCTLFSSHLEIHTTGNATPHIVAPHFFRHFSVTGENHRG